MSYERLRPEFTFDADRLEQLKAIAPESFADGAINWDVLHSALGDYLEDESADGEHFGLFWPGKRAARRRASEPRSGTLIPVLGEGVNENSTRNIFIEADNLDTLKLLQKAYAGRVKMIYIDPPYNTGNDFVYRDDFREVQEDYLRRTGQADGALRPLTTNPQTGGRFHSNWLNMIYPRLLAARTMLREDGVIFVSIDDNEVHNLRLVMDEIFGGENFVAQITIVTNPQGRVLRSFFSPSHDYLLVYIMSDEVHDLSLRKSDAEIAKQYTFQDEGGKFRLFQLRNTHRQFGKFNRPNLFYPLYINPQTGGVGLEPKEEHIKIEPYWDDGFAGCWTWDRRKALKDIDLLIARFSNEQWKVYRKSYVTATDETAETKKLQTVWNDSKYYTRGGQKAFDALIPERIFQSPKPVELVQTLLQISTESSDLILDFFAGSGTTAHAVMAQNAEDGGNRQFVLVQLPEETERTDYPTISAITAERIRRAGAKIAAEQTNRLDAIPLDLGFRFYRFAPSNYKTWQDVDSDDLRQLELAFDRAVTPLIEGWQPQHLLTEVMLLQGYPLDSSIEPLPKFTANTVQRVTSDFHAHSLYTCFDESIAGETIGALALNGDDIFVCLDSALTDESKARLADVCNLRTI